MRFLVIIFIIAVSTAVAQPTDSLQKRQIVQFAEMFKNPLQGEKMLNFSAPLLNDSVIELKNYSGNVIVLNFWFIGCPPCLGEINDFNKVYNHFKDSSVSIISLANNTKDQLQKFVAGKFSKPTENILYPIVPNASGIIKQYEVVSYPTTVLIDKKGIVRLVYSGATVASLKKYVDFYGEKGLSKEWKQILKNASTASQTEISTILTELINDLLKE